MDVDGAFFITEITNSGGQTLQIDTPPRRQEFQDLRNQIMNNLTEYSLVVQDWSIKEYNVTITSNDFSQSRLITRGILIAEDPSTGKVYFVKTSMNRCGDQIPADFFTVGEQITVNGVILDQNGTELMNGPFNSLFPNVDGILLGLTLQNSSGQTISMGPHHGPHPRFGGRLHR